MKSAFSTNWKKSVQPRKQRKFRANAPLHIKGKFLNAPLSKELNKKYSVRSMRVKKGDKVKVLRGQFKGAVGKVEKVSLKYEYVHIAKVETTKKDGSKKFYPVNPSNVVILELDIDKNRQKRLDRISNKDKVSAKVKKGKDTAEVKK